MEALLTIAQRSLATLFVLVVGMLLVRNYKPFRLHQAVVWILGLGFVAALSGAVIQVATGNMLEGPGELIHEVGAILILYGFLTYVIASRIDSSGEVGHEAGASVVVGPDQQAHSRVHDHRFPRFDSISQCIFEDGELTPAWIEYLRQMPNLRKLVLRRAAIGADALERIDQLSHLEILYIDSTRLLPGSARIIQVALPACRVYLESGVAVDQLSPAETRPPAA